MAPTAMDQDRVSLSVRHRVEGQTFRANPFTVSAELKRVAGEVHVTPGKAGTLLLFVLPEQVEKLLLLESLCAQPVHVEHYNRPPMLPRGVIRCRDLHHLSVEEITDGLRPQGIIEVKKLTSTLNPQREPGYVLTFDSSVPEKVKIGYIQVVVAPYKLPPLRCYKCQRYGHRSINCARNHVCPRCAKTHDGSHDPASCTAPPRCTACRGPHDSRSTFCPQYKKERDAKRLAETQGIPVSQAKMVVSSQISQTQKKSTLSYAAIASISNNSQSEQSFTQSQQADCQTCPALEARIAELETTMKSLVSLPAVMKNFEFALTALTETVGVLTSKIDNLLRAGNDGYSTKKKRRTNGSGGKEADSVDVLPSGYMEGLVEEGATLSAKVTSSSAPAGHCTGVASTPHHTPLPMSHTPLPTSHMPLPTSHTPLPTSHSSLNACSQENGLP